MEDLLKVGVITTTHGVRGEVKVYPTTDEPERFLELDYVLLDTGRELRKLEIKNVKFFKNLVILKFKGVDNINDIEKYKGRDLWIPREEGQELEEDEYYIADLLGMSVVLEDGQEFGTLKDVMETGANDVYVVEDDKGEEILLPAIRECILDVDVEKNVMTIHLMKGLIYMNFHVLTLFPEMIENGMNTSITGRAITKGLLTLEAVNIRDYAFNKHQKVDDYTYGGGAGMLMQAEPVYLAYEAIANRTAKKPRVVYLTPQGQVFNQAMAREMAQEEDLVFLCGHYEGIDERVLEEIVTDYVSIGDYVLTGGELPAMVMMDSISRMVPGVLNNQESGETESFAGNLLEYPQYSRPEEWHGKKVPEVLMSGHHANIEKWRREQSIYRTAKRRPDLLKKADLTNKEWNYVRQLRKQWKEEEEQIK